VALAEGMRLRLLPYAVLALAAAGCGGGGKTTTVTVTRTIATTRTVTVTTTASASPSSPGCLASALTGNFAAIPGSAGAGQIGYRLRLTNQSDSPCFLSGLPQVQLLDQKGAKLPTAASAAQPGTTTAVRVELKPGDAATADARFSPDVPGGSEPGDGPCEPKAYTLRVTIGDGTLDAPIVPPTPVCERGSLSFSVYTAAS
jgi:Protein of unknown function (DUF4232)